MCGANLGHFCRKLFSEYLRSDLADPSKMMQILVVSLPFRTGLAFNPDSSTGSIM